MNPRYIKLKAGEKVIKTLVDKSTWTEKNIYMSSGSKSVGVHISGMGLICGTLFITNLRIIFEDETGAVCREKMHIDIEKTVGKDYNGWTVGNLQIVRDGKGYEFFEDGTLNIGQGVMVSAFLNSNFYNDNSKKSMIEKIAQKREQYLDYETAIELYEKHNMHKEASRVRRKMLDEKKVAQTVVHGDYVDDRDTIVKDSVINRSNIGAGGDDKVAKLEKIANMKKEGLIDDDEFKQMKKEILGK